MSEIQDVYADQFRVTTGAYGVATTFSLAAPHPSPAQAVPPRDLVTVRMSLEHAKVMTMVLRRQLKEYERGAGITIQIPHKVYADLGVSPEDW